MALAHAFGVNVAVLEVGGSATSCVQHPSSDAAPLFWLVHLPGHYEVVYPQEGQGDVRLLLQGWG
jgi:hypothetical protein